MNKFNDIRFNNLTDIQNIFTDKFFYKNNQIPEYIKQIKILYYYKYGKFIP